ncbi:hypothetical protein ACP70R_045517 [Stipagrostis hirtigluma subsp. patula]
MEGGSSVDGGGVFGAAQEPRADKEEEKAGAGEGRGAPMKFRVCARAPHGVGALLLIGGAAVLGAAVVAWRHAARRGKDGGAESRRGERQPAKEEALNGGVIEDEKCGMAAAREIDDPHHEDLSREKTGAGSNVLDGDMTGNIEQIHEDTEILADESENEPIQNSDHNSRREPKEISMHAVDGDMAEEIQQIHDDKEIVSNESDGEPVEKSDCSSRSGPTEISIHDVENENVEKFDHNSMRDPTEISMHFVVEKLDHNARIPVEITTHDMEHEIVAKVDEYSSKNDIKKEIAPNDNNGVEISDQSTVCIKGPEIVLHEHINHSDGAQEPESMENTPTAQLLMHQEQLLDDMMTETVEETEEEKQGERTITDKNMSEQEEDKASAEPVQLVSPPVLSSLVKPTEKKVPQLPGRNEMGMKLEQDCTKGSLLKEHDLIKGGPTHGGALMTMDRRIASMALLALVFAVTIGITIVMRTYAPLQAT